ncbi:hypothetical protein COP2_003084 [Malus domestica]
MYFLHIIGALIKERVLVQKSKRHHSPHVTSALRTGKNAQPLLTFKKRLPTRLLAQKSKRHCPPNLESQTPNKITFSKIEKTLLSESQESDSQYDCFLKNQRGIALRISRARLPTGLHAQKSKRRRPPNLESQIPNRITFLKIEKTLLSESQESNSQYDCFLKNRRGTVL